MESLPHEIILLITKFMSISTIVSLGKCSLNIKWILVEYQKEIKHWEEFMEIYYHATPNDISQIFLSKQMLYYHHDPKNTDIANTLISPTKFLKMINDISPESFKLIINNSEIGRHVFINDDIDFIKYLFKSCSNDFLKYNYVHNGFTHKGRMRYHNKIYRYLIKNDCYDDPTLGTIIGGSKEENVLMKIFKIFSEKKPNKKYILLENIPCCFGTLIEHGKYSLLGKLIDKYSKYFCEACHQNYYETFVTSTFIKNLSTRRRKFNQYDVEEIEKLVKLVKSKYPRNN